jgi:threonine dehydratase
MPAIVTSNSPKEPSVLKCNAPRWSYIAELSILFRPLMEHYSIRSEFLMLGQGGPCMVDATRNETNAYKLRGALACTYSAVHSGASSVWTASAGNHGAGVALAAQLLGIQATVYVPTNAPAVKVEKIKSFGARVISTGSSFDDCLANARTEQVPRFARSSFIHPFDDNLVVAGQGTIGLEILDHVRQVYRSRQLGQVTIFIPIGGGGLIAGITSVLRGLWPMELPAPRIVGVVDEGVPASVLGTLFGRPISAVPTTIADGTRVARVGEAFLEVAPLIDNIMVVPHDSIVDTMRHYYTEHHQVFEASGALALTGEFLARKYTLFDGGDDALRYALLSGRNVDSCTFDQVLNEDPHHLPSGCRRVAFDVKIPERKGELLHFLRAVRLFNITSLTYKQQEDTALGTLRAEFEISEADSFEVGSIIAQSFPGSVLLAPGAQLVLPIIPPVAQKFQEQLISLDDHPGSFLRYVEKLRDTAELGQVGFLYYRKPTTQKARPQVVIGST